MDFSRRDGSRYEDCGSVTLDREDLLKSAEPDNGYYIQSFDPDAAHTIDLSVDPAPDLVVEVDITHADIEKNALYAILGVLEFWRLNGREWRILRLQEAQYIEQDRPPTFPFVQKTDLYEFLEAALMGEMFAEAKLRK